MKRDNKTAVLPDGISQEMVDAAKVKFGATGNVKYADLYDGEGNMLLTVLITRPIRPVLQEFERNRAEPKIAADVLINGCLLSHKDKVKADQVLIQAAFNAITELIPIGTYAIYKLDTFKTLPEGISQEMINEAVADGRIGICIAQITSGENEKDFVHVLMCAPSRDAISNHQKYSDTNPNKARTLLLKSALLSHKETVLGNDWLYYTGSQVAVELKPKASAVVKNC